jgi:GNAT superfamily N-acetyltransferase
MGTASDGETVEHTASDPGQVRFRKARRSDIPAIAALIAESARALGSADYSAAQIDAALKTAWGVDTQLIDDETYYVAVAEHGPHLVACGGWSHRHTLFGGDAQPDRMARELDPELESARIRAFFVHPAWSRMGLGRRLLEECESDAQARGFRSATLVATLPGQRLYAACGYQSEAPEEFSLGGGQSIAFVSMHKRF